MSRQLKTNIYFTISYLLILGIILGATIYAGAVVAPVTFHSKQWLSSEILSRFQEGLIMTQNFVRLGYFLVIGIFLWKVSYIISRESTTIIFDILYPFLFELYNKFLYLSRKILFDIKMIIILKIASEARKNLGNPI